MNKKFLKLAGVKSMDEFYTKYPDEETFIAKCGAKIKKAYPGVKIPKNSDKAAMGALFGNLLGGGASGAATGAGLGPGSAIAGAADVFKNAQGTAGQLGGSGSNVNTTDGGFLKSLTGGKGVGGALKGLTGGNPIGMAIDTIQGFKAQKERVNQSNQNRQVVGHLADARESNQLYELQNIQDARQNSYVRPEDNMMTGEELFPMYGVGTNVLAKDGATMRSRRKGKRGYKKAQNGFLGTSAKTWKGMGMQGLNSLSQFGAQELGIGGDMGSQIGGKIGSTLGAATGIPGMDTVGQFVLGGIGDALDRSDSKIKRYNTQANRDINKMIGIQAGDIFKNQFSANAKDGVKMYGMGGDVQTLDKGGIKPLSNNPYSGPTDMIHGPSHKRGGVDMNVLGQPIEAEGGEPMVRTSEEDGSNESISIMGNLKIPKHIKSAVESFSGEKFSGSKFKSATKSLSEVENKVTDKIEKNVMKADDYTPLRPLDRISLSTLHLNNEVADKKLQKLQVAKDTLASVQESLNEEEENAKYGKKIKAQKGISKKYKPVSADDSGMYGNVDQEDVDNFIMQNQWYEGINDFDPTDPDSVKAFQEAYNTAIPNKEEAGLKLDGKFGPETASAMRAMMVSGEDPKGLNVDIKGGNIPKKAEIKEIEDPEKKDFDWLGGIGQLFRDTDAEAFDNSQLTPELWAMANNQLEPVQAQKYQPRLRVPYDISLQDQLNQNTAKARSAERMAAHNPGMLANLKAQEYMADQQVLGNQFRQNQGFKDQIYSGNLQTLNDANLKNLAIADTQYQRQEQAKSNTKATELEAIKSMTDKRLKNRLENRTLQVMENMYDYRYGPGYRANYVGEGFNPEDMWQSGGGSGITNQPPPGYEYVYDASGRPVDIRKSTNRSDSTWQTPKFNPNSAKKGKTIFKNGSIVKNYKKFK